MVHRVGVFWGLNVGYTFVCDGPVSHTLLKRTPSCMYITAHQSLQMKTGMGTPASNLHIQEPRPWVPRS